MNKDEKRSTDFRELIIRTRINGESYGEFSKKFHISNQSAMEMFKIFEETGFIENLEEQGQKRKATPRDDS